MNLVYETKDSSGEQHIYFYAGGYLVLVGEEVKDKDGKKVENPNFIYPFVGGAELNKDFRVGWEEQGEMFHTQKKIFIKPDCVANVNFREVAKNPARIGDHLVVRDPAQEAGDPRRGFNILRGRVISIITLEDL